jgi:hypothetical protein
LLINNASTLGPSPQPTLAEYPLEVLREVYEANVIAPLALTHWPCRHCAVRTARSSTSHRTPASRLRRLGRVRLVEGALEQVANVLAAEEPDVRVVWFDPGDMRTQMHQEAFPGEDISDRPLPATVVPVLLGCCDPTHRAVDTAPPTARGSAVVTAVATHRLRFDLPPAQEAGAPPRPAASDATACACSSPHAPRRSAHTTFDRIVDFLSPATSSSSTPPA